MTRKQYKYWVYDAIRDLGGKATPLQVAKHIWQHHKRELEKSGDSFYNWQYEFRWGADALRKEGMLKSAKQSKQGVWELA